MKSLIISPHDDDLALFCCFSAIRTKALAVICLDSYVQPNRGEVGCSADERAAETAAAHEILGVKTLRLGLHDDIARYEDIHAELLILSMAMVIDRIYAPAIQGGNRHHDDVGRAALAVFGDRVKQYTTYTRTQLYTTGNIEIVPTAEELELKNRALECYVSQLRINRPHFDAVRGKSEWIM